MIPSRTSKPPYAKNVYLKPKKLYRAEPITGPRIDPAPVITCRQPTTLDRSSGKSLVAIDSSVVQFVEHPIPCSNLKVNASTRMFTLLSIISINPKMMNVNPIRLIPNPRRFLAPTFSTYFPMIGDQKIVPTEQRANVIPTQVLGSPCLSNSSGRNGAQTEYAVLETKLQSMIQRTIGSGAFIF